MASQQGHLEVARELLRVGLIPTWLETTIGHVSKQRTTRVTPASCSSSSSTEPPHEAEMPP